jgi:dTDP-4-amino-4,6-dideoxygalactose transaminase
MSSTVTVRQPGRHSQAPIFAERLRFIKPTLPALEDVFECYQPSYRDGLLTNAHIVSRFEAAVAERLGVRYCIAVSSCTTGLMLVLRALDLAGEIAVPSFTFFATGHAAIWNSLRPVFIDCDRHDWTIDPADLERKITEHTCAILAVHLYGNPCKVDALERIAQV